MAVDGRHMNRLLSVFAVLFMVLSVATGCSTMRSVRGISVPESKVKGRHPRVAIQVVVDSRVLTNINCGDTSKESDETNMQRKIACKKTYNKGLPRGYVLLPKNQSVEGIVQQLLEKALRDSGFKVVDIESAGATTWVLDVIIDRFWTTYRPEDGRTLEAWLDVEVMANRGKRSKQFSIGGFGKVESSVISERHWRKVYALTFETFLKQAQSALQTNLSNK